MDDDEENVNLTRPSSFTNNNQLDDEEFTFKKKS